MSFDALQSRVNTAVLSRLTTWVTVGGIVVRGVFNNAYADIYSVDASRPSVVCLSSDLTSAVRRVDTNADAGSGVTPTVALNVAALSTNPLIGAVANSSSPAAVSPPAGWTEYFDGGNVVPAGGLEVVGISSGFNNAAVTWGSASTTAFGAIVAEFDTALSGVTTPATVIHRLTTVDNGNLFAYVSGSFTPAADDLLAVFVAATGTLAEGSITNSAGLTFTRVASVAKPSGLGTLYLFVANQKASPVAQTCTFFCDYDAASGAVISVLSLAGIGKTGAAVTRGTTVVANGTNYTVAGIEPDGAGMTRLLLEAA